MKFRNSVVLVTGGGAGIGKACALRFAQEGAKVIVSGLEMDGLEQVRETIVANGGECLAVRSDAGLVEETEHLCASAAERFGNVNILINNAATTDLADKVEDLKVDDWDGCLNATLRSVFLLSKLLAPGMRDSGGGAIVNISSVGALNPWSGGAAYCSAKAGVLALTKVLAIELGPSKIRVNAISPGAIMTPNLERTIQRFNHADKLRAKSVFQRIGEADEIAAAAAFLACDEASFITGANLLVDGGFTLL